MLSRPHLKWPFEIGGINSSKVEFVDEGTPAEVAQCVGLILATQPGELIGNPAMGLPDPTFRQGGITAAALDRVIRRWEPRAKFVLSPGEIINQAQEVGVLVQ